MQDLDAADAAAQQQEPTELEAPDEPSPSEGRGVVADLLTEAAEGDLLENRPPTGEAAVARSTRAPLAAEGAEADVLDQQLAEPLDDEDRR